MSENNYPKLHNAMWPGLVGKGPDSEPIIELDTLLDLTVNAEVDGQKFDGVDLFLCAPHVDIDISDDGKIVKIAEAMGVVAALVPSTNPTSTAMFKAIISLKCRNGIVASPHPKAVKCTTEALNLMTQAAESAGAPKGLIHCLSTPTLQATEALMKDKNIAVILATGSTPMVKAAYSAGTPAYGVGSGNVPAFIERTANYKKAVADIAYGTTFDYGTLCSSEQAMIVDRPLKDKVITEAKQIGCFFVDKDQGND